VAVRLALTDAPPLLAPVVALTAALMTYMFVTGPDFRGEARRMLGVPFPR